MPPSRPMATWKRAAENIVRHHGGTYYLRGRVSGKIVRVTLETSDLRIAKLKAPPLLESLRQAAEEKKGQEVATLGDALREAEERVVGPHLKKSTRIDYKQRFKHLRETMPINALGRRWSAEDARCWWKSFSKGRSPHKANQGLRMARKAISVLIEHGLRTTDPTEGLRPMRVTETTKDLPSRKEIERVIENVRSQRKRVSAESSNYLAFLAFTGCRHGEIKALCWEHVGTDWITIAGGKEGTKNRRVRQVPISPPLRPVIKRMHYEGACGPLFTIKSPRFALTGACSRLGLSHLRIHDLRHWFGSWAIESGVDIPTVAKWMGHQDGGALLMRTYAHLSDRHSLKQVKRLK